MIKLLWCSLFHGKFTYYEWSDYYDHRAYWFCEKCKEDRATKLKEYPNV